MGKVDIQEEKKILEEENKQLKLQLQRNTRKNGVENFFYKYIKWISIITALLLVLIMDKLGNYTNNHNIFFQDLRNLAGAILVGMLFSFLLSIKSIRTFLLKSISHFMSDDSYIDRLDINEVKRIKGKIANRIHGTDLVSNKESLFNHFEKLDKFLSIPHKSIVDEKWIYEEIEDKPEYFKLTRVQDFRVHTLDSLNHSNFDIIIKNQVRAQETFLEELQQNFKIKIIIDSQDPMIIDAESSDINFEYDEEEGEIRVDFVRNITLIKEFTQVHIEIEQYQLIDDSHATFSSHATYHLNYNIQLPENYEITNVYHSNTLHLNEQQVNINQVNCNNLSVNINGWQLPGLIFVYTYKKK